MPDSKPNRITLGREKYEHSDRLKRSMKRVRWSGALMRIFWTAGPVTGLGLIGGYYIGYGRFPSLELLLYFISFTVFTGLIGLLAKVVYDATRGHLHQQGERDVRSVSDKLGDLILVIRDLHVQSRDDDNRAAEAALQLLRRVDLTPYGVSIAFTDLTSDSNIGAVMGRLHAYRRVGLHSRAREIYEQYRPQIEKSADSLEEHLPLGARELRNWFDGSTSGSLKQGVEREPFFLQRVMAAIEYNNPYLMTIRDVEEMIILAFELINGREIPTLVFSYAGKWKYATALDNLERKRSQYRVAQARGGNRIRALAAYLRETGSVSAGELPNGLSITQLIEEVTAAMDRLSAELRVAAESGTVPKSELRQKSVILKTALELYKMAHEGYRETGRRHSQLIEAVQKWEKVTETASGNPADLRIGPGKRGLRIRESVIELNDEARLEVSRYLAWYFDKERLTGNVYQWLAVRVGRDAEQQGELIRRIAIEIALALEPHIRLSKPEIQRNINATKAICLGELSPNMSAGQKAELGKRMSEVVDNSTASAAEQLAEALVRLYHVKLGEEAREFLHETYGARRKMLELLENRQELFEYPVSFISERPPIVPPPKTTWNKVLASVN